MTRIGTVQDPIPIYSLVSHSHPIKEDGEVCSVGYNGRSQDWTNIDSTQSVLVTLSEPPGLRTPNQLGSRFARISLISSSPSVTLDVQVSQPILTIQSGWLSMIKSRTIGVLNVAVVCVFLSLLLLSSSRPISYLRRELHTLLPGKSEEY
jgi:hypothetical protein